MEDQKAGGPASSRSNERLARLRADLPRLERLVELGVHTQVPTAREDAYNRLRQWIERFGDVVEAVVMACSVVLGQLQCSLKATPLRRPTRLQPKRLRESRGTENGRVLAHTLVLLARLINHYTRRKDEPACASEDTRDIERRTAVLYWLAARIFPLIDSIIICGIERLAIASLPAPKAYAKAARDRLIALVYSWRSRFAETEEAFEQAYFYTFDVLRVPLPAIPEAILRPRFYRQQRALQASLQVQIPTFVEHLTREFYTRIDEQWIQSVSTALNVAQTEPVSATPSSCSAAAQNEHRQRTCWLANHSQLLATWQWVRASRAQLCHKQQLWSAISRPASGAAPDSIGQSMSELEQRLGTIDVRLDALWTRAKELGLPTEEICIDARDPSTSQPSSTYIDHWIASTNNHDRYDGDDGDDGDDEFADIDFVVAEESALTAAATPEAAMDSARPTVPLPQRPDTTGLSSIEERTSSEDAHLVLPNGSLTRVERSMPDTTNEVGRTHFTLPRRINRRGAEELERLLDAQAIRTSQVENEHLLRAFEAVEMHLHRVEAVQNPPPERGPLEDPLDGFFPLDLQPNHARTRVVQYSKSDASSSIKHSRKRLAVHLRQRFPRVQ
jgi:hypothetical protein